MWPQEYQVQPNKAVQTSICKAQENLLDPDFCADKLPFDATRFKRITKTGRPHLILGGSGVV